MSITTLTMSFSNKGYHGDDGSKDGNHRERRVNKQDKNGGTELLFFFRRRLKDLTEDGDK